MGNYFDNEEWRPIVGYEGIYEVSNFGRIKSLNYNHTNKDKILKTRIDKKGYVRWSNPKHKSSVMVHRVVAEAFIPNPEHLQQVNHKDECKTNNSVENLEWCTNDYNSNYGTRNNRISLNLKGRFSGENSHFYGKIGKDCKNSKPVLQFTLTGDFVNEWDSVASAVRQGYSQHISSVCRGERKQANGYFWIYKGDS